VEGQDPESGRQTVDGYGGWCLELIRRGRYTGEEVRRICWRAVF